MSTRLEDVGYRAYDGPRTGRVRSLGALARDSALRALGAGRGWRGKIVPVGLIVIAFGPAIVVLGLRALFASQFPADLTEFVPYAGYYSVVSIAILALAGVVAPDLLCPDRRDRVLDLYFATACSPREYLAAKLAAMLVPLLSVTLLPVLFLFGGNVLFAVHPLGYLEANWRELPRIVAAGFVIATYFALVALAVSSLTGRRPFAMGGVVALLIAGGTTSAVLNEGLGVGDGAQLLALPAIPVVLAQRLFPDGGGPEGVSTAGWFAAYAVVCLLSLAVLAVRYRRAED